MNIFHTLSEKNEHRKNDFGQYIIQTIQMSSFADNYGYGSFFEIPKVPFIFVKNKYDNSLILC